MAKAPTAVSRITNLVGSPCFLLMHPSVPVKNMGDLVALAKSRPGQITVGSGGIGQITHLAIELLKLSAGIDMLHVPYKGMAAALPELVGGQISLVFSTSIENLQFARAGRVKALAVTSRERVPAAPDVPTVAEQGLAGFEALGWNGLVAPANVPREIIQTLNRELVRGMAAPDIRERLTAAGSYTLTSPPEAFGTFIRSELEKWGKVVRHAGIKME